MGIGFSIFLIAIGAIIAFGVDHQLSWLSLAVVGWVLMLAGISGLVLTLYFWSRRRQTTNVVEERRYYDGRPVSPSAAQRTRPTEPLPEAPPATRTTRSEYRERPAPPG